MNINKKQELDPKKDGVSVLYWLINFTSNDKRLTVGTLNPHSILELIMVLFPKTNNLYVMESLLSFIKMLF